MVVITKVNAPGSLYKSGAIHAFNLFYEICKKKNQVLGIQIFKRAAIIFKKKKLILIITSDKVSGKLLKLYPK